MTIAITRRELGADGLRREATRCRDAAAARRMLALALVLEGGSRAAAQAHLARTACRRAERAVVALAREEAVNAPVRQYLNRLSDLMFVLARYLNREAGRPDVFWTSRVSRQPE